MEWSVSDTVGCDTVDDVNWLTESNYDASPEIYKLRQVGRCGWPVQLRRWAEIYKLRGWSMWLLCAASTLG